MVPLPVIDGVHRVALSWRTAQNGATAANVMHFKGASADPDGLWTVLNANVTSAMWSVCGTDTAVYQVAITPLNLDGATRLYQPTGAKWAGVGSPGQVVLQAAQVVSLRTAKRGRRYRGRVFIPFPLESNITNGLYGVPLTTIQAAWDAFRNAMSTGSWPMVVASYGHSLHKTKGTGGSYTMTPVSWTPSSDPVVNAVVENAYGTQRRRQSRIR